MNNLTVLILAAGYGKRMGSFSRMINKGLIPYKDKPLISHIFDRFPKNTKFVIACGHLGDQLKNYYSNVYKDYEIIFQYIDDYSENNTGPATTILKCKEHLPNDFFWIACDTVFDFQYQNKLDHNWIAVSPVDSSIAKDYCWVERDANDITKIHNKISSKKAVDAFIGLMFVKDHQYIENLEHEKAKETPQGFLPNLNLKAYTVNNWLDFGTYEKWQSLIENTEENSFPKPNEIFYKDNNKVIKFFKDTYNVEQRVNRSLANPNVMPKNLKGIGNFLIHDWVEGDIVYNQASLDLFQKMIDWCENKLWIQAKCHNAYDINYNFYWKKTKERLLQIRSKYSNWSEPAQVNQQSVESIDWYLNKIDIDWLCKEYDWRFIHGDLHFDNTIYNAKNNEFTAIDWRTDFGGELYGDIYYDLAKLLGGLYLNYKLIKADKFSYLENNDSVTINVPSVEDCIEYEKLLKKWVIKNNLSWKKVKTLVPIIYLNMSPLHDFPFDKFLVSLSQLHFSLLNNEFN